MNLTVIITTHFMFALITQRINLPNVPKTTCDTRQTFL